MSGSTITFPVASEFARKLSPRTAAALAPATTPTTRVESCYDVLDLCRACGIDDFTDGIYDVADESRAAYLAAQQRQANYLLDQVDCKFGTRILDIGCGYGRILKTAGDRGAEAMGITISPRQVTEDRRRGLSVYLCNYRDLFRSGAYDGWEHAFDGIVANGSLEHFVQVEDAATGRADDMYAEFFEICRRLLRPGGKMATTAIHARRVGQVNPHDLLRGPAAWPKGSETYHAANLHRSFGGWYPEPGQLESVSGGLFKLTAAVDGTEDYLRTSEYWVSQIRRSLVLSPKAWAAAAAAMTRQPRAAWRMLHCLLVDQSWNYQFRDPAPAQLWRHTWQAV